MKHRLEQLERRMNIREGGICPHAVDVQFIGIGLDGQWQEEPRDPLPCPDCGLRRPALNIFALPVKAESIEAWEQRWARAA